LLLTRRCGIVDIAAQAIDHLMEVVVHLNAILADEIAYDGTATHTNLYPKHVKLSSMRIAKHQ